MASGGMDALGDRKGSGLEAGSYPDDNVYSYIMYVFCIFFHVAGADGTDAAEKSKSRRGREYKLPAQIGIVVLGKAIETQGIRGTCVDAVVILGTEVS